MCRLRAACEITSDDAQPVALHSKMQLTMRGWARSPSFATVSLLPMLRTSTGDLRSLAPTTTPRSDGSATVVFSAPLTEGLIELQRREDGYTVVIVAVADDGAHIGQATCDGRVFSYTLQEGLPQVVTALQASLARSGVTTDVMMPEARATLLASHAFSNATRDDLVRGALVAIAGTLAATPLNMLPPTTALAVLTLVADSMSSLSSAASKPSRSLVATLRDADAAAAAAPSSNPASTLFRAAKALYARIFTAQETSSTLSAVPLSNETAGWIAALSAATGAAAASSPWRSVFAADTVLAADAAGVLASAVLRAPSGALRQNSVRGLAEFVAAALPDAPPVESTQVQVQRAPVVAAAGGRVLRSRPVALSLQVDDAVTVGVATLSAAASVVAVPAADDWFRASVVVLNGSASTLSGRTLSDVLVPRGATRTIVNSVEYTYVPGDTIMLVNLSSAGDDFAPLAAINPTQPPLSLSVTAPSSVFTRLVRSARPDLSTTADSDVLRYVECGMLRPSSDATSGGFEVARAGVASFATSGTMTTVTCAGLEPCGVYLPVVLRPAILDVVVVTTTPAPPPPPRPPTVLYVENESNKNGSVAIAAGTIGAFLALVLVGLIAYLVFKHRQKQQRQQQAAQWSAEDNAAANNSMMRSMTAPLLVLPPEALFENRDSIGGAVAPSNGSQGNPLSSPSNGSGSSSHDLSPIRRPLHDSAMLSRGFQSGVFTGFSFVNPAVPLPPIVAIDEELRFVPKRRPLPPPESDPTPWL
jgi:hypothetical protein